MHRLNSARVQQKRANFFPANFHNSNFPPKTVKNRCLKNYVHVVSEEITLYNIFLKPFHFDHYGEQYP